MRAKWAVVCVCVALAAASVGCSRTDCIEPRAAEEVRESALERANTLADGAGLTGDERALFTDVALELAGATLRQRPGRDAIKDRLIVELTRPAPSRDRARALASELVADVVVGTHTSVDALLEVQAELTPAQRAGLREAMEDSDPPRYERSFLVDQALKKFLRDLDPNASQEKLYWARVGELERELVWLLSIQYKASLFFAEQAGLAHPEEPRIHAAVDKLGSLYEKFAHEALDAALEIRGALSAEQRVAFDGYVKRARTCSNP
jgi:hypothetical protein